MSYVIRPFPVYYGWSKTIYERETDRLSSPIPLEVYVDEFGLLRQKVTETLRIRLQEIYLMDSNIGYLQDGHELCDLYGSDFYEFLVLEISHVFRDKTLDVLEIGSGGGYLAKQLTRMGHRVTTLDPSPLAARVANINGWSHIADQFPSVSCKDYDLVINMDVWEHTFDPYQFIIDVAKVIRPGGLHITSIPDCGPSIAVGDHGIFMHQHISYFTEQSVFEMSRVLPCEIRTLERSKVGGSLYISFIHEDSSLQSNDLLTKIIPRSNTSGMRTEDEETYRRFEKACLSFQSYLCQELKNAQTIGLWNPLRAIPYLSGYDAMEEIRFFDHDNSLRGMYPSGWNVQVEGTIDLLKRPCDIIIVLSLSWGSKIRERLKNDGYSGKVVVFTDVLKC